LASGFIGGTHTRRLADNLVSGLTQAQIAALRAQLGGGAGGELRPTKTGKRPAHAPYSSAVLAMNAFGRWLGFEEQLRIGGLAGFSAPLEVESRQVISHGGGTANLDVLLRSRGRVVGVESKLTETLSIHRPVAWREPYATTEMAKLLEGGWADVFAASRKGGWQPRHLGIEQLIKHALALASRFADYERHLVYVWWEPVNATEIPELLKHRDEVDELRQRVGDASPHLHALTYTELFAEWAGQDTSWVAEHLAQLDRRYAVSI